MQIYIIYGLNILVAGWISYHCLICPEKAHIVVFEQAIQYSEAIKLVGALWFGVFLLSCFGLFFPQQMSPILVFQFIYKLTWLIIAALPAFLRNEPYPKSMALFFIFWVIILPIVIPWKALFGTYH